MVNNGTNQISTDNPLANVLQSGVTGTTPFITGNITRLNILQTNVVSTSGDGVCFDLSNNVTPGSFFFNEASVQRFDDIGTFDGLTFSSENVGWVLNGSGLTMNNMGVVVMTDQTFFLQTGDHITLTGTLSGYGFFGLIDASPSTGDALFNLDPALSITKKITIRDNPFSSVNGGTLFDPAGLDQTDPKVVCFNNGNELDSYWAGVFGFLDNATNTVITTVDTYTDIAGTIVAGANDRWSVRFLLLG